MNQPKLVPTFTDAQAADLFRRAIAITLELDPPEDLRLPTFNGVASMLAQFHQAHPAGIAPAPAGLLDKLRG